jgi:hypothetical protein
VVAVPARLIVPTGIASAALAAVGALVLLARGEIVAGVITAAVTLFAFRLFWNATRRRRELLRRGYFAGQRVGSRWVYEELHQGEAVALEFELEYAGRGAYDIRIPGELAWRDTMPAWARGRREEIIERLGTVFKRSEMRTETDPAA